MPDKPARAALVLALLVLAAPLVQACAPRVEEHPAWLTASFRPHLDAFERCGVDEATYVRVIAEWLAARPADAPRVSSLSLGRAVSYPWLSRHLADSALRTPGWAAHIARAKPGERQPLAAPMLNDPSLLGRLDVPFEGSRYQVIGVSFEKVLFGNAADHTSERQGGKIKVPFDALLWLRLGARDN